MMMKAIAYATALFGFASATPISARLPESPMLEYRLRGAVAWHGDIWGWSVTGALLSYAAPGWQATERFETGVIDATVDGGILYVLRGSPADDGLTIERWTGRAFVPLPPLAPVDAGRAIAFAVRDRVPIVLLQRAAYRLNGGRWTRIALDQEVKRAAQMSTAFIRNGASLYVGTNQGEWGGGVQRVDLVSGTVSAIKIDGPITGLLPDPRRPGCVYAAAGIMHFSASGRISRICKTTVALVFERRLGDDGKPLTGGATSRRAMTEPFFSLAADRKDGFWAVSPISLHHFGGAGPPRTVPIPVREKTGNLSISTAVHGIAVIATDLNAGMSLSGATPLIVALDDRVAAARRHR